MNCPKCKQANQPERNYCGKCGNALMQYCRSCGFRNRVNDKFCGGCGCVLAGDLARPDQTSAPTANTVAPQPDEHMDNSALTELLEAARASEQPEPESEEIRVSQDDIDSLFGG